ncbi:MAG: VOC family protein [Gemmatimonadota bacterium]|nr:MAG: VOC family protein [Gemmatimonadota bacterium]
MPEMTEYPHGTFCWVDLATSDAEGAKHFYSQLFDWNAHDLPTVTGTYTMFDRGGKRVSAMYTLSDEMREQGVPPHWMSYLSVRHADECADMATRLGGTVLAPPYDVMEAGRMALVQDPTGAVFAVWQPKQHHGAGLVNEPGSLCWNELYTKDLEAAARFYAALVGWAPKKSTGAAGQEYTEFHSGDRLAAGMIEIQDDWGVMPPNWAVYFAVADCEAALEKAKTLGGRVEVPAMDIEGVGRFAFLQDPQGAYFAVIEIRRQE